MVNNFKVVNLKLTTKDQLIKVDTDLWLWMQKMLTASKTKNQCQHKIFLFLMAKFVKINLKKLQLTTRHL